MFDKGQKQSSTLSCDSSYCIKLMQYIFFQSPETSLGACKENRKGIAMDNKLVD